MPLPFLYPAASQCPLYTRGLDFCEAKSLGGWEYAGRSQVIVIRDNSL